MVLTDGHLAVAGSPAWKKGAHTQLCGTKHSLPVPRDNSAVWSRGCFAPECFVGVCENHCCVVAVLHMFPGLVLDDGSGAR